MCRCVMKLLYSAYLRMMCCAFSSFHSCTFLLLSLLRLQVHLVVGGVVMKGLSSMCKYVWLQADCVWHERTEKLT